MSTSVLVLAAGGSSTEAHGEGYPACLAELDGVTLIERIVGNTRNLPGARHCFAILERDAQRFRLDRVVSLLAEGARVVRIPENTRGSACTALLAAVQLPQDDDLLVVSANELVDIDLAGVVRHFRARRLDAGTLTFRSVHPRYSYVRLGDDGLVEEAAQQDPISQHATAGVFWFARASAFVAAAKSTIRKDARVADRFYLAPTFNELILQRARIGTLEIPAGRYRPLKNERQLQQFETGQAGHAA
jgi:CTP:molybdopterin cytidylyltransferase MocA